MNRRAHPAFTLSENPGIAWIATIEDQLDAAELRPGAPGIGDETVLYLDLDEQMPFDTGDRVNHQFLSCPRCWRRDWCGCWGWIRCTQVVTNQRKYISGMVFFSC
jgi:hypothetical protein